MKNAALLSVLCMLGARCSALAWIDEQGDAPLDLIWASCPDAGWIGWILNQCRTWAWWRAGAGAARVLPPQTQALMDAFERVRPLHVPNPRDSVVVALVKERIGSAGFAAIVHTLEEIVASERVAA